ncbi:MAG TPA: ABC transporter ATP-binding protein [Chloroflexota bacterium]|nr:ABC transporter ATP-binding protein [Chloroflexota bacterium]
MTEVQVRTLIRFVSDGQFEWRLWLMPLLVTCAIVPVTLSLPLVQRDLIDNVVLARQLDRLLPTTSLFAALWILSAILQVVLATLQGYLDERLTIHLRRRLFAHCGTLSIPLWQREQGGRTMTLFLNDAPSWAAFLGSNLVSAFGSLLTMLIGVVLMFRLNAQLALIAVCFPAVVGGLAWIVTRPLRQVSRRVREKTADLNAQLQENLSGLREIAAFGQEQRSGQLFAATMTELLRLKMRLAFVGAAIGGGQNLFSLATMLAVIGVGGYLVIIGQTTLGTLLAIQQLFGQIYVPARSLLGIVVGAQQALSAADRLHEFFELQPAVKERVGARDCGQAIGAVCFDRVDFAYEPGRPVLRDISFVVEPGEVIALVGPSGAGKSTLASLIARFRDPDDGRVLLDGMDLRDLTLESIRRQIAFVFQDPFLFGSSIRENIALGRNEASEAEIIRAAQAACAWEFIEKMPKGLDTIVGPRGNQLSEGQKQRVAIARALLRNPRILILDEPTSALDARSEHLLEQALENLMRGRTTFIIAHRLATISRANRILVLDEGRVVEQGTHAELLARRGLYHELHELQFAARHGESPLALVVSGD